MNPSRRADLLLAAGLLPCAQAVLEPTSVVRDRDLARAVANAIARDPILTRGAGAGGVFESAWGECDCSRVPAGLHATLRERCCRDERRAVSRPMASPVRARRVKWSADRDELIVSVSARAGDASTLNLLCADILGPSNDDVRETLSYAAVVEWQRTWAKDGDDESRLFWRFQGRRIRDDVWPYQERPAAPPFDSGFVSVELSAAERDRVTHTARERGAAFPALLLACWQIVWWRLTNSAPVVGVVLPARRYPELEQVPGPLDRTVPHAVALRGPSAIADAVRVVDQWWRSAVEWQEHCEFATTRPGPGHVFHLGYVHTTWRGVTARLVAPLIDTVGARLSLVACDVDGQPFFGVQFHRRTIAAVEAQRFASAFAACLCDAIERPTASLDELRLMRESARAEVLTSWNETAVAWPADTGETLAAWVGRGAAIAPDAVAVWTDAGQWTYARMHADADRLARRLRRLGAGPETRVAVWLTRGPLLVTALLAVVKAGAAYVPFDPSHPAAEQVNQLADAQVMVVLTEQACLAAVPKGEYTVEVLEPPDALDTLDALDALDAPQARHASPAVLPAHLAYIIYTSGSTGQPKGAMNAHAGVVNRLAWMQDTHALAPGDRVLQKTSISFDVSVWELFWPLGTGATLVLARPDGQHDPRYLAETIARSGVTVAQFVPSTLEAFAAAGGLAMCGSLRLLVSSGEGLPGPLASRVRAAWPGQLENLYGPTEAAVDVTCHPCDAEDATAPIVPIGRPIANARLYIVDRGGEPMPVGATGELMLGGVPVGRGYWNRPAATAASFVPDRFSGVPGARLYRTGDRARYRLDGVVEYVGRADHLVTLRGHRIELGEIEAALRANPNIREAVAILREDTPGEPRLVAYVVPAQTAEAPLSVELLRRDLRTHLPDVMVPAAIVCLPALPLMPNGKVDRRQLPVPDDDAQPAVDAMRALPLTQAEEIITGVWAGVLGRAHVAASDHFFDIGGHSLNAVQVLVRLREIFGREIELHTLFDHPTPATLARALMATQAVRSGESALEPASLEPVSRDGPLPLSFAQERIWIVDQLTGSRSYHVPLTIGVTGSLDALALAAALRRLVVRHEVLRTTIDVVDDRPVQRIEPAGPAPVVWADLSNASTRALAHLQSRTQRQLERAPFDLRRGPLWRVAVLRCAADRHLVCGTLHHIVTDGWSIGILLRDIAALYEAAQTKAAQTNEAARLPALPIQYADYAAWQRRTLSGERLATELAYWREQLADVPTLALPTDRPRLAIASGRGAVATRQWPDALAARTRQFSRERGATAFMVMLAAWQAVLARYAGQRDVAVGVPIAQRPRPELEGLIGIFLNTVVVRTVMPARTSWASLVACVRTQALAAYAHQLVPFEQVIADLQPQRDLARGPLFQVMFVLQNYPAPSLQVADLRFEAAGSGGTTAKFDLELTVHLHGDDVVGQLQYATDLFDRPTAERMLGHIETLIDAALASPDLPVDELPLLTAAEQTQIVHEWNATAVEIAEPVRIEHRIAAAAVASPDRLAIVGDDTVYRYGELHARSTRLARHLRRLGVARDRLVTVLSDRGAAAIVGFLGVLKAGAGYVPLSPDDPVERLRSQVQDLGSRLIVCAERCAPLVAGLGFEIVTLDEGATWEGESDVPILADGGGDDVAYAMYTSGSTGQPKAVVVRHGGLVNYTDWMNARLGVPAHAAWQYAVVSSLQADLGNTTLYAGLTTGGTVHVLSHLDATDPTRVAHVMTTAGIDVLKIVPTHLQALIEASDEPLPLPRRWLVLGGERLTWDLAAKLRERGVRVLNHYGPTETTVGCVAAEIETSASVAAAARMQRSSVGAVAFGARASVPIGRPIANTCAYVRDAAGGLVPAGIPGELFIGGAGVARGYWRQPALTAERFVPDPYGPPGGRLYRTGDLVRADASGVLEFVGRRDHQVKVRGHRVELGEIEHALRQLPGIRQAAVVMREDTPGHQRIAAYVVPADGDADVSGDMLQRQLGARLPAHMVPPVIVSLPALPITANGKLDRRRLPEPGGERPRLDTPYIAPRTEMESAVARLWAEGLRLDQVGIHDNFFALGGDSIAAIQFAHRAQRQGLSATPLLVFQHQTVAELAANLAARDSIGEAEPEFEPEISMTAAQLAYLSSRVELES